MATILSPQAPYQLETAPNKLPITQAGFIGNKYPMSHGLCAATVFLPGLSLTALQVPLH